MAQQLSLSARPKTLDALIGQKKLVEAARGHAASGRLPKAWLLSGPTGCGKTTAAKILAVSYECKHQTVWGNPCKDCYDNYTKFSIQKVPIAVLNKKEDIEKAFEGSEYGSLFEGDYRIYILDEAHVMTPAAQSLCLDYLESSPESAVFILTTTDPDEVKDTLRGRCQCYELRELNLDDVGLLVRRLLKKVKSELPADRLVDALGERGIKYPRHIAQAVEKYVSGLTPEDAAMVEGATDVDTRILTKAVTKGDWEEVSRYLLKAQPNDMKSVRRGLLAYLRTVLLENPIDTRNEVVAKAISALCNIQNAEHGILASAVCAEVYRLTALFAKYKL